MKFNELVWRTANSNSSWELTQPLSVPWNHGGIHTVRVWRRAAKAFSGKYDFAWTRLTDAGCEEGFDIDGYSGLTLFELAAVLAQCEPLPEE